MIDEVNCIKNFDIIEILCLGIVSNHVPSSYDSTGLRMIQTNYRDSSSSPRSPSARRLLNSVLLSWYNLQHHGSFWRIGMTEGKRR